MEREPLCAVAVCPSPSDPWWHRCFVCQATAIDHQHVDPKRMGGSPSRDIPSNIVALCRPCHEKITLNEWSDYIEENEHVGRWYFVLDRHGQRIASRALESEAQDVRLQPNRNEGALDEQAGEPLRDADVLLPRRQDDAAVREVRTDAGSLRYAATSLTLPQMTLEEWGERLRLLAGMHRSLGWWLGDAMVYGEDNFGAECWQYADQELGIDHGTLLNYASVSRAIPAVHRAVNLSWSAHRELAPVFREDAARGRELLSEYEAEGLSTRQIHARVAPPETVTTTNADGPMLYVQMEKMWTVAELRESLAGYTNSDFRNNGRAFCEAWLETLEEDNMIPRGTR